MKKFIFLFIGLAFAVNAYSQTTLPKPAMPTIEEWIDWGAFSYIGVFYSMDYTDDGYVPLAEDGSYLEEVGFRTSTRYPFTKFCLVVDQTIFHPTGKKLQVTHRSDTITCHVSDENGKPQGDGLDIFQYVIPFRQEELSAGDSIHVSVTHGMQRTAITGIVDVGIRLFKP